MFTLNPGSGQPLYLQLIQRIRHAIETGLLQPGDALPGIRTLAGQLVVSPNTVVKAYSQLEADGFLELRPGSGAYVAVPRTTKGRTPQVRHAQDRIRAFVDDLLDSGLSEEEIHRLVEAELFYPSPAGRRR